MPTFLNEYKSKFKQDKNEIAKIVDIKNIHDYHIIMLKKINCRYELNIINCNIFNKKCINPIN